MMSFYVYLPANRRNGTLYTGMTDNLLPRIWTLKNEAFGGFTGRYAATVLVRCEGPRLRGDGME